MSEKNFGIYCRGIEWDFSNADKHDIDEARNAALIEVRKTYLEKQEEEKEYVQDLLDAGDLDFPEDYEYEYREDFEPENYTQEIEQKTKEYLINIYDLPASVVIYVDESIKTYSISQQTEFYKETIGRDYGMPVKDMQGFKTAVFTDVLKQQSYDNMKNIMKNEDYQSFIDMKSNLRNYSYNNISLVYGQKPQAQAVKGYNSWQNEGRQVAKGAKAIWIFSPCMKVIQTQKKLDEFLAKEKDIQGDTTAYKKFADSVQKEFDEKGVYKHLTGFTPAKVFDIADTFSLDPEHDNIGKFVHIVDDLTPEDIQYKAKLAHEVAYNIDSQITSSDELYNKINDYVHYEFNNPDRILGIKSNTPSTGVLRTMEELVATSLISKQLGINDDDRTATLMNNAMQSQDALFITMGKRKVFETAFQRGSCLANQFIKAYEQAQEREEARRRRAERHEMIENNVEIKDVSYYVLDCFAPNNRKEDSLEGYVTYDEDGEEKVDGYRNDCLVTKEIYLSAEMYDYFTHQLLDDFSFLAGMGGSNTDDPRLTSMNDYYNMTPKERETVQWYYTNCVAVYRENELKLVIDPQGYDYARYVYFVDEESKIADSLHKTNQEKDNIKERD